MQGTKLIVIASTIMFALGSGESNWDAVPPGTMAFFPIGLCGDGSTAYYGLLNPFRLLHPDKFFIEIMGGAICFSKASCTDHCLSDWMSIVNYLRKAVGVPNDMIHLLTSGTGIPLKLMNEQLPNPGYLPLDDDHPMAGRRGIYFPTCTGDIALGKHTINYSAIPEPTCPEGSSEELGGQKGTWYRGCTARTRSGRTCQKWGVQWPHKHSAQPCARTHSGLYGHNFCRNPHGLQEDTIWCYTTDPNVRWEYCDPGDLGVGNTSADVDVQGMTAFHHGGKNFYDVLQEAKSVFPDLEHIAIYGGSGGGVASIAWSPMIADMWPAANVAALADSGLHSLPGTMLFKHFYERAPWGPGLGRESASIAADTPMPDFDWRQLDAVASHISSFDGRVTAAHVSCIDDKGVLWQRKVMANYAQLDKRFPEGTKSLVSKSRQHDEAWSFLTNLEACAPNGTVYSYILNCSEHHLTRNYLNEMHSLEGTISVKTFVENFLVGEPPDPDDPARTHFWYEQHEPEGDDGTCPSEVRRRRAPAPPVRRRRTTAVETSTTPSSTTAVEMHESDADSGYATKAAEILVLLLMWRSYDLSVQ
eukprot:gnl/TRDRNA2_/TRDRNA2_129538_c0_seq1.p1 gnl/TRDRNA2_/TRDRNA2_129538_c0~~gnl/TRDRNA2_/TRDRNA2_129538_c0_seq1.p1  ORF type:complete len:587 (+),score=55.90 gnl/TRDRNA2_/TRDRNA2_129538_c0_seq1:2-1762(+)